MILKNAGLFLCCLLFFTGVSSAETMRVGIKPVPPFAIFDKERGWSGISVELWQNISTPLGWKSEWVVMNTPRELVDGLTEGSIDIAVGALSMTPEREAVMDFSHAFYSTGLAIAAPVQNGGFISLLSQLMSPAFLSAVSILIFVLLGVGALLWLVERKRNPDQFGGSLVKGIGNGFWWSAVTMTTVGYGDKSPITASGRILATIWMFVSVITISGFTAAIASSFTLDQLTSTINDESDLGRVRTLAVAGTTGELYLQKNGIRHLTVATPSAGLTLLREGKADALVHDESLLRYLLKDSESDVELLPKMLERQDYAFGLKPDFIHRETFNRALLTQTRTQQWVEIQNRYLGQR